MKRSRNNSNSSTASTTRDRNDTGIENVVLITKWGDSEIIGALVMRVFKRERKAVIRAWTVKIRYRGNGVGRGLLEEGVRVAMQRGCVAVGGKGVEFEGAHANSHRVLPELFNRGVERREKRARAVLEEIVDDVGGAR